MKRKQLMKKIIKNTLPSLLFIPMLLSCGSLAEVSMGIGNALEENSAIRVDFSLPNSIKSDTKINFKFYAEKNIAFAPSYSFSIFDIDPLRSESYHESVLINFEKEKMESLKKDDGNYGNLNIEVLFSNPENYFAKTEDKKEIYFVFHTSDWSRKDITKYSAWGFQYTYSNDTVSLFVD